MSIYDGGNIEFVFNTIDDYRDGLSGDAASAAANAATSSGFISHLLQFHHPLNGI